MVQVGASSLSDVELNQQEVVQNAPPEYGRHQLDALYNDINASGYMSRAPSGSSTPFYAQSRNASSENLQSLAGVVDSHHHPQGLVQSLGHEGHFAPNMLRSRLANLADQGSSRQHRVLPQHHSPSGGNTPHNGLAPDHALRSGQHSGGGYFASSFPPSNRSSPPPHSPAHSVPESRRASGDAAMDDEHGIHQQDYDMGTLSRVPSYGAAVRTPGLVTPYIEGPPSYFEATSRPPSPVQRPSAAHIRTGVSTPNSNSSVQTLTNGGGPAPVTTRPDYAQHHSHGDESRLRMLRARGD